jgi:fluoroquinolone transport system permease protein
MKPNLLSMRMFFRQIRGDSMLYMLCFLPFLIAALFRFGIPFAETQLTAVLNTGAVLSGYYLLLDLFLAVFAPYFLTFISAMVMLSEIDEHVAAYLIVTPVRRKGYVVSRLAYPALLSVLVTALLTAFCALTEWTLWNTLLLSLMAALVCLPVSMLIVSYSHNRVEGMALAKLSGLLLFGLPAPFFLTGGTEYLFCWLPSFWISKVFLSGSFLGVLPFCLLSAFWIWLLYRRFQRKFL